MVDERLEYVHEGDEISSKEQRELIDVASREISGDAPMMSTPDGTAIRKSPEDAIELYEIVGPPVYDEDWMQWKAQGKPVVQHPHYKRYQCDEDRLQETVWFPTSFQDTVNRAILPPNCWVGQRVPTIKRTHHRWALLPSSNLIPFIMTEAFTSGESAEAVVHYIDANLRNYEDPPPPGVASITVHDIPTHEQQAGGVGASGLWSKPATVAPDHGADGWAMWLPSLEEFVIVNMAYPGDFWGKLYAPLSYGAATAEVEVDEGGLWCGYDHFGVGGGTRITVHNRDASDVAHCFGGNTGETILCRWDILNEKYWIVAIGPNSYDYVEQAFVTRISHALGKYYTRTIELAPWTDISDPEAEHDL